jgi:hypothetical protein
MINGVIGVPINSDLQKISSLRDIGMPELLPTGGEAPDADAGDDDDVSPN